MKTGLLVLLLSFNASAEFMAIYGEDNRQDVYAVTNPMLLKMAIPTAAMIPKTHMQNVGGNILISAKSLGDAYKLCPQERFRQQPTAANCSGTLVAPDLIMTAGHCYQLAKDACKNFNWVFDYKVAKENQNSVTVANSKVYECQEVLLQIEDHNRNLDHALIRLKTKVSDRHPAKFRQTGSVQTNMPLVLIGHPSGLPTKIADGGSVLSVSATSFKTNLDAFSVNSGSGVFNQMTGELEGILASGQMDYDGKGNCSSTRKYQMHQGNEKVMLPTAIKAYLAKEL